MDKEEISEDRKREINELATAYVRLFRTEDGELVLKNLKTVFGYRKPVTKRAEGGDGHICPLKMAALSANQEPVEHIVQMIELGEKN